MATEKNLQAKILKALKRHGGFWFPVTSSLYMRKGLPDIIGCYEGLFVGLEVKLPGEPHPVTELQRATLDRIEAAGGIAAVVHSVDEALDVLDVLEPEQ